MVVYGLLCMLVYLVLEGIDRVLSIQTLTRPIVIAPFIGLVLGDFKTGIIMGGMLESIFMGISAIGGSIPADHKSSTVIAVAFTILASQDIETGLSIAMPIGTVIVAMSTLTGPIFAALAPWWEKKAYSGDMKSFKRWVIFFGMFLSNLTTGLIIFFSIAYGVEGLQALISHLPAFVMRGLNAASGMMVAIGFAILTSMIWNKEICAFFFAGFVLTKYLGLGSLPLAILATVVAVMYFFNEKKFLELRAKPQGDTKTEGEDFF